MKKIEKLCITPEKIMKNEELLSLRGGYDGPCTCLCKNLFSGYIFGYLFSPTGNCYEDCRDVFGEEYGNGGTCQS